MTTGKSPQKVSGVSASCALITRYKWCPWIAANRRSDSLTCSVVVRAVSIPYFGW